jgi:beta-aspartyl-dipeptidase (metallo-type)
MMLTLIENGEIFAPEPLGRGSVLIGAEKILKIGTVNRQAIENLGLGLDVIDATDCVVTPGLIDPHEHLLGGSGEKGFASQTPEITVGEVISAGITTVVGCLGVDTTMKTLAGLLAKVKAFEEEGLNAYMWTGGYHVPPTTISQSVDNDIMFIAEVIGVGEIAISDERATAPTNDELARIVREAHNGGMLGKKAGVTHFHVGSQEGGLQPLRTLIEEYKIEPARLYPTHINRNESLILEAIELAKKGAFVDIDTVDEDLPKWLKFYLENGGLPEKLTLSSDASINSPHNLFNQFQKCVVEKKFPLAQLLPMVTSNTAKVLSLSHKGTLEQNKAADVLILRKDTLEIKDVLSKGRRMIKNGKPQFKEKFLEESNRHINLRGEKAEQVKNYSR